MIDITVKTECCGCSACAQKCSFSAIKMIEDEQGFLYPFTDIASCINCDQCKKVCPVINKNSAIYSEPDCFACICIDDFVRLKSSSGGLFTLLAETVINSGGVVFGARFESDWSVIHDYTESIKGLDAIRCSKYVQSSIGNNYLKTKEFLREGRVVLFTGTPCQIAGLNHFLEHDYDNLIRMDIACHSVPSPKVWRLYLSELQKTNKAALKYGDTSNIKSITFRSKKEGWRNYGIEILGKYNHSLEECTVLKCENHWKNSYMRGFLQGLYIRPSCASCPARNYTGRSDITLADFWGVEKYHPEILLLNDNKGVSLALVHTERGKNILDEIKGEMYLLPITYNEVEAKDGLHCNLTRSVQLHKKSKKFYSKLDHTKNLSKLIEKCLWQEELKQKAKNVLATQYSKLLKFCS